MRVGKLRKSVSAAQTLINDSLDELGTIKKLITDGRDVELALLDRTRQLENELRRARETLNGDRTGARLHADRKPSISGRLSNAWWGMRGHSYGPTRTQERQYEIAREEYEAAIDGIRNLIEVELVALKTDLDKAGAPWTPGRAIPDLGDD